MNNSDLLQAIFSQEKTEAQGAQIISASLDSADAAGTARRLGLSRVEWTAFAHGAALADIAFWRYQGWPTACALCKSPIDVEGFGWQVIDVNETSCLRHLQCPDS
jgi:hypothetical protein